MVGPVASPRQHRLILFLFLSSLTGPTGLSSSSPSSSSQSITAQSGRVAMLSAVDTHHTIFDVCVCVCT